MNILKGISLFFFIFKKNKKKETKTIVYINNKKYLNDIFERMININKEYKFILLIRQL